MFGKIAAFHQARGDRFIAGAVRLAASSIRR